jgi:GAF domain-containing protein/CheY-like chemotaxis protein
MALQTTKTNLFQARVVSHVRPRVMAFFAIMGLILLTAVEYAGLQNLEQSNNLILLRLTESLNAELSGPAQNALELSRSSVVRQFAEIAEPSEQTEEMRAAQQQMLQLFADVINNNDGYLSVRYLTRSGVVFGEINRYSESYLSSVPVDAGDDNRSKWTDDVGYIRALSAQNGEVVIGPPSMRTEGVSDESTLVEPAQAIIQFYAPVFGDLAGGDSLGTIQVEIRLDRIISIVNEAANTPGLRASGRILLLEARNRSLADSVNQLGNYVLPPNGANADADAPANNPENPEGRNFISSALSDFLRINAVNVPLTLNGLEIISAERLDTPILGLGWRVVLVYDTFNALAGVQVFAIFAFISMLFAGFIAVRLIDGRLGTALVRLKSSNRIAQQMVQGTGLKPRTGSAIVSGAEEDDEIGQIIDVLLSMSNYVREVSTETNKHLSRRNRNLEIAARISRETAKTYEVDTLVNNALGMICDYLDFYHAQVYLVDDAGVNAILYYSYGERGQLLLQANMRHAVGSHSIVGGVAATGKSVFVNDTEAGTTPHAPNPLLPKTRAEIGVPLFIANRVLGVLDIQSSQPDVFQPEDLPSFELIADQLAIAIHKTTLQREKGQSDAQVEALTRRMTRAAWQDAEKKIGLSDYYRYNLLNVDSKPDAVNEEDTTDIHLNAEISIRGEVIGKLAATAPEGQVFTEGDQVVLRAVAERVALAIENARLFQETQNSLLETSTLYQMGRYLNESDTLENIIQAIIRTVMPDAVGGQIWTFDRVDGTYQGDGGQWLEIIADFAVSDREEGDESLVGLRLRADDHQLLREIHGDRVSLVTDTEMDSRLDDALRGIFQRMQSRSVALLPLNMRGEWSGILSFEFAEPREFSEQDGRAYSNIIDQAGTAIDNRLLNQETEQALARNEDLYAASRIINTAQTLQDLVYAAVRTSSDPSFNFALVVLEGELDESGWPTQGRIVAESLGGKVQAVNIPHPVDISTTSPLREREPMLVMDYNPGDEDVTPQVKWLRERGDRFNTIFPLFSGSQPIALFYVTNREERELTTTEYEVYRALTGQMSTVLWNKRLLNQTAEALDQTQRLYEATQAITRAQEFEQVYEAAAENLGNPLVSGDVSGGNIVLSTHISHVVILLAEPEQTPDAPYLRRVYVWGRSPGEQAMISVNTRIDRENAPLGRLTVMAKGAAYYPDLNRDPSAKRWIRAALDNYDPLCALVSPLQSRQKWLGALICVSDQLHAFDAQYLRFTQAISDQVAIAVENKLLFEEAQMEARRAQLEAQRAIALAEVGQLATRIGSEFERNISDVVARVSEQAGYDRWLLMLKNEAGSLERLTWRAPGVGLGQTPTGYAATLNLQTGEHSIVDAVRLSHTIVVNDPIKYAAFGGYNPQEVQTYLGRHISHPISASGQIIGALMIGRAVFTPELDERDEQFVNTLAAQITIAVENRNLFRAVEDERQQLRAILQTMPAGVLVLDPITYKPVMFNDRVEELLGRPLNAQQAFTALEYDLYRTGTELHYPNDELPIYQAMAQDSLVNADDVAVIREDLHTDLLLNAAPIRDAKGQLIGIVAAFQDISALRSLENTLQENLRETVALYETTRALSEAGELDDVLSVVQEQMLIQQPDEAYVILMEEDLSTLRLSRYVEKPIPYLYLLEGTLDNRNTICIENVQTDSRLTEEARAMLQELDLNAIAATPVRTRLRSEVPLGWLMIAYRDARTISDDVVRGLESLRDQAATAIDNRYLIEQTRSTLEETTVLYRATRALAGKEVATPSDILEIVIDNLIGEHIDQAFVVSLIGDSWDAPSSRVQVLATWQGANPIDLQGMVLTADQFPAWSQLASTTICTIDDTAIHPDLTQEERTSIESLGARSVAILPLRVPKRAIGAIWLSSSQVHKHSDRELRTYQAFAEQASIALEATRLLQQTERRARQLLTSAEVSKDASRILDLSELLPRLVDLIRDQFGYDHVQIFLLDDADEFAMLRASTGEVGKQLLSINHKLKKGSRSVIGRVTESGDVVVVTDTADPSVVHKPNPYLPLTRSEMALPLSVKDRVVGALDVQSNQPNAFSEEDIGALTTLAAQISVAIDNASLYNQSQQRATEMAFLFELTTSAASGNTMRDALRTVAERLREDLPALAVTIYIPQEFEDRKIAPILQPVAVAGDNTPLSEVAEISVGDQANLIGLKGADLQPLIVPNIEEHNQTKSSQYTPVDASSRSAIIMPLASANRLVGMIAVESDRINAYDIDTQQLLLTLSGSLSAVIQNAQLLDQVRRANDQLRESDRLKSDFLANMSHELRTPLNSIIGFSRVMLKGIDGPLTEMQEQDLNTIYTAGQHLLGLINDILDQAKIAANKLDLKLDYFEIKPLIDGVKAMGLGYAKQYEKNNIGIVADVRPGLPKVYGDEFRTRQVLNNLLSNAIKFTPDGAVTISAYEVTDAYGRQMVQVDVTDTGIGIADKDIPLLFEAFRQVDSSLTRTAGGTGLGLPISKSLVEMQGGTISVRSQTNIGSVFSITIPIEPMPEKAEKSTDELESASSATNGTTPSVELPKVASAPTNGDSAPGGKRATKTAPRIVHSRRQVLLIEDNPDMVDQYRRIVQREGFEVFNGDNPFMAEAMAGGLHPTLILMDANFAGGAGWDLLQRLKDRDDTFDIPVIVASLNDDSERAYQAGAHTFVRRPFMPEQLVEAVLSAEQESSTERILIIDDQPESVRLLTQVLDEYGNFRVFSATNANEGISLVARRRPDLIILDLRMPAKDGFAVLDELRSNPETSGIPVMVVTGETIDASEQELLSDVRVMSKTDITPESFEHFIKGVRANLSGESGD